MFRGLALAALALPVNYLCGLVLQATGRSDVLMRWSVITMVISVLSILLGLPWGVVGVAYAWSIGVLFVRTPGFYLMVSRHTVVSFADLRKPVVTYALPFLLIVGFGGWLRQAIPLARPALALLGHGAVLAAGYGFYLILRGRHRWVLELLRSLKSAPAV